MNSLDFHEVYLAAVKLTTTTFAKMNHFNRHYCEYSCYFFKTPHNMCASEIASIVVFRLPTPVAIEVKNHYEGEVEDTEHMWDLTASIDLNYIATNFGKNQLSKTWLDILATDRPEELHYELKRSSGQRPRRGQSNSCLDGKIPRDYVTIKIINKKRLGDIETLTKLTNTLTHKAGDVFTNDITTRKNTYWLLEQLSRTIFGRIDG